MLAQHLGAIVFTTVGSPSKRDLLVEKYSLPASHILSSTSARFKDAVLLLTGGKGVDVVLSSHAGEKLEASFECTADFGRFVEIGKAGVHSRGSIKMAHFGRSLAVSAVDFNMINRLRPRIVHEALGNTFELIAHGKLRSVAPITTFPLGKAEEAFSMIAARRHTGKLVLLTGDEGDISLVQAVLPDPGQLRLNGGTYVIAGGLGDLGRRACRQLAEAGAECVVTLSRSFPAEEVLAVVQQEVEAHGCVLRPMRCDVTDSDSVSRVAEVCRAELPPVKGVIHSGLVLRDRPLELMTPEEYAIAVRPKVHGTLNLHSAFSPSPDTLDFFVLMASSAGIIGTKGQANYAAGNTFQDAFARLNNAASRHTRYVSIDIGAVAGTGHIERTMALGGDRSTADMNHIGLQTMSTTELDRLLHHAIAPGRASAASTQYIVGFDGKALAKHRDSSMLRDPLYRFLFVAGRDQDEPIGGEKAQGAERKTIEDTGRLVDKARTMAEVVEIITRATAEKFSVFLGQEVPVDVPVSQIAIDSLVSIELRNWMSRTFQAPVTAAEVSRAQSISALAATLASRSKRVSAEAKQTGTETNGDVVEERMADGVLEAAAKTNGVSPILTESSFTSEPVANGKPQTPKITGNTNGSTPHATAPHGHACCKLAKTLPKHPLVDLDEALDYMLANATGIRTRDELAVLKAAATELRNPKGVGRTVIYKRLQDMAMDPGVESWQHDFFNDSHWLRRNMALMPYSNFFGSVPDIADPSGRPHTQASRAAAVVVAAMKIREDVDNDAMEPMMVGDVPFCMARTKWLFSTTREPGLQGDRLVKYDDANHLVVLRRGHAFRVALEENGRAVGSDTLEATFEKILSEVQDEGSWAGLLTCDSRDAWAKTRQDAMNLNPDNAFYINTLESALLILCLDDGSPANDAELVQQAWLSNGFNRWADKSIQVIVTTNGRVSIIAEHAALDGLTIWPLIARLEQNAPRPAQPAPNGNATPVKLHPLTFTSTPVLDTRMVALRTSYTAATSRAEYLDHTLPALGTTSLMKWGAPIRAAVSTTVQLAIRLYYGRSVPTWTPVSTAMYHLGRHEMLQVATPSAVSLCTDLASNHDDSSASKESLRTRLLALGREAALEMRRCQEGRNHHRFLEVMREAWRQATTAGPVARLLDEGLWFGKGPFVILSMVPEGGKTATNIVHGVPMPGSLFLSVVPDAECVRVMIYGEKGVTESFSQCLDRAAAIVKKVVQKEL